MYRVLPCSSVSLHVREASGWSPWKARILKLHCYLHSITRCNRKCKSRCWSVCIKWRNYTILIVVHTDSYSQIVLRVHIFHFIHLKGVKKGPYAYIKKLFLAMASTVFTGFTHLITFVFKELSWWSFFFSHVINRKQLLSWKKCKPLSSDHGAAPVPFFGNRFYNSAQWLKHVKTFQLLWINWYVYGNILFFGLVQHFWHLADAIFR